MKPILAIGLVAAMLSTSANALDFQALDRELQGIAREGEALENWSRQQTQRREEAGRQELERAYRTGTPIRLDRLTTRQVAFICDQTGHAIPCEETTRRYRREGQIIDGLADQQKRALDSMSGSFCAPYCN